MTDPSSEARRQLTSGAVAGAASAIAFTALHHVLISDIWFSLPIMVAAGALSGLCLAWTYRVLFGTPSTTRWWLYNGVWVALLALLGVASFLVYEPEMALLVMALIFGFAGIFQVLERRRFGAREAVGAPSPASRAPTA
jgi:hypothetical protein